MGGDGIITKNRRRVMAAVLFLFLLLAAGFLSFRLGRREGVTEQRKSAEAGEKSEGRNEAGEGDSGAGTGIETGMDFGKASVAVAPCSPDGLPCDFSVEPIPPALVPLADRMLPELAGQERIAAAAAFYRRDLAAVYRGMDGLQGGSVLGIGPDFLAAAGFQVEKGQGLTERDIEEKRRAALLDGRAAQALFSGQDPVGETIEVEGCLYQVVGVADLSEPRTGGGLVLIPESTWPEVYQYEEPKAVVLKLTEPAEDALVEAEWEAFREETGTYVARMLNSMVPEGESIHYRAQE